MNLLALETSTNQCSAALLTANGILDRELCEPRAHTRVILPMIDDLLNEAGLVPRDLDMIAYGAGPGAFTGLRIGVSVAQGLGFGAKVPLCAVSSLAIVAAEVLHENHGATVCVAQDARMGEVYTGRFRLIDGMARVIGSEALCPPSAEIVMADDLVAGDAWARVAELETVAGERAALCSYPHARFALGFALMHAKAGTGVVAEEARLNYLRDRVADKL